MKNDPFQWLSSGHAPDSDPPARGSESSNEDADLLDAYSQAVIGVVDAVSPAVISVASGHADEGAGSGFIVAPDGYAVTNSHVVGRRPRVRVITADRDRIDATVIGNDPATDIALMRIAATDLPFCQIGDSDGLRVGQLIIAMGSPFGLHSTVSTGVVSAVGRSMRGVNGRLIENVVQHSAPINPGNSGGPLVDSRSRVVGVNTAIIAFTQGLGFAVPSSTAQWVVSEMLQHGRVRRRTLGILGRTISLPRSLVRELDLLGEQAVEVMEVQPSSAAERAGLALQDLIVSLQGRIITSVDDIHRLLIQWPLDQPLAVSVVRDGVLREVVIESERR